MLFIYNPTIKYGNISIFIVGIIFMNEYTLYHLITKKITYLTDRVEENPLLLPILTEYHYHKQYLEKRMYTGAAPLIDYLQQSDQEMIRREILKLQL